MPVANPHGHYHFLEGEDAFSQGVIADPGYEIVRVTLGAAMEWCHGFDHIRAHLTAEGLEPASLCAVELRSPAPMTPDEFASFNAAYRDKLSKWDLLVGGLNPVAGTNVAPMYSPPAKPELHAFSYTVPSDEGVPTLVISSAAEGREGGKTPPEQVVCYGRTDFASMRRKGASVMKTIARRLVDLGGDWDLISGTNLYTVRSLDGVVDDVLDKLGPGARYGTVWYHAWPSLVNLELGIDMRAIRRELFPC